MLCGIRAYVDRFDRSEPSGSGRLGQDRDMYRLIRQAGIFLVAFFSCASPGMTWDDNWTVVTMTRVTLGEEREPTPGTKTTA